MSNKRNSIENIPNNDEDSHNDILFELESYELDVLDDIFIQDSEI